MVSAICITLFAAVFALFSTGTLAFDDEYKAFQDFFSKPLFYSPSFTAPLTMRNIADKIHTEGYDLSLPCKARGSHPIAYSWFINGIRVKSRYRLRIRNSGKMLRIQRLRARDSAVYTCIASNKYGNLSFSYPLKIREKPGLAPTFYDLEDMTNLMFKTIGETARFRCEAKSDLPVKYSWFKNGKPLRKHRRRISYNNFQLRIKRLTLADGANYTCVANNTFGSVSYNFTLHMILPRKGGPPRVTTYRKENYIKAKVGQNVSLECLELASVTLPYVSWYKWLHPVEKQYALQSISMDRKKTRKWGRKEYQLISSKFYTSFPLKGYSLFSNNPWIHDNTIPHGLRLTIPNVTLADSGMYTCAASNFKGSDLAKLLLQVYV